MDGGAGCSTKQWHLLLGRRGVGSCQGLPKQRTPATVFEIGAAWQGRVREGRSVSAAQLASDIPHLREAVRDDRIAVSQIWSGDGY